MTNSDAIIGLVLDRSGSMATMWDEAVGGFNTFKNQQANNEGTAWMTLVAFDNEIITQYDAWDAKDIPDLSQVDDIVFPRGMTALYDATSQTITKVEKWLADNEWFEGTPFVVIITDGHENASREMTGPALKKRIIELEGKGWKFIYLAANVDLDKTRMDLGLSASSAMSYTGDSVAAAYSTASSAVTRTRGGDQGDLLREDERDASKSG